MAASHPFSVYQNSIVDFDHFEEPSYYHSKVGVYNLQNHQKSSNSRNQFYYLTPNIVSAIPASLQGKFVDFKLDSVPGFIYKSFVLSYTVSNNTGAEVNLIPGPFHINNFEVQQNGQNKLNHDSYEIFLKNTLFEDTKSSCGAANLTSAGINPSNITTTNALADGASRNILFELPTFFTSTNVYRPRIGGDVVLRLTFNSFIGDAASEVNLNISNITLYITALSISKTYESYLFSTRYLDYRIQQYFHIPYPVYNGYTSNIEFTTQLSSTNFMCSCMFIWLQLSSPAKADVAKNYPITSLRLTDGNNQNLLNGQVPTTAWLKYLCNQIFFPDSSFFNDAANNIVMLSPSTNPACDIAGNEFNGAIAIKENYKLSITPATTHNEPMVLNVVFYSPSIYEIDD